jgi:rod shape-determining protein MreD
VTALADYEREPRGRMILTSVVALALSALPLPYWLAVFRPQFLVLVVLYWSITAPRAGGLMLGLLAGLALDVFQGSVLGEHALALSLITYIAVREHLRIRSKPLLQQALMLPAALVLYEFVAFAIDGWTGHPMTNPLRWVHAATGAISWPLVSLVLTRR